MAVLKDLIVHGASRFINVVQFNSTKGGVIAADKGVFNKLIATSGEIGTLNVEELNADTLTAQNATVMGLLDVKGDLHTNSWTNSNIATIQGNFYIAPTVMTGTSSDNTGVTITALSDGSATNGYWQMVISGTNILVDTSRQTTTLPGLESDAIDESDTAVDTWSSGSAVMVTGSIKKNGITYPLGTLKGVLSGPVTTSGATITKITDNLNNNPSTLQEYGAGTYGFVEIKISLYKRAYNNSLYPLGILMSAQGRASKSFIDIYGGSNINQEGTISGASTDYGGLAIPNVRIGNLRGLPNVITGDFTDDANLPTGWGIYTDNGYFKGTVVATSGNIGGALISNGLLQVGDANITNVNANKINAKYLDTITANMGVLTAGRIQGGTPGTAGFMYIAPEDYNNGYYRITDDITYDSSKTYYTLNNGTYVQFEGSSFVDNVIYYEHFPMQAVRINDSGDKTDWRLILGTNFGIDSDGILYAKNVHLRGSVIASEFKVEQNGITYISSGVEGITIGSNQKFNLLIDNEGINFYDEDMKVAYINNNTWFTEQANVLNQLLIGFLNNTTIPGSTSLGHGQWAWAIHQNDLGTNNLYLKWVG